MKAQESLYVQTLQSIHCLHIQNMDVDEDSDLN